MCSKLTCRFSGMLDEGSIWCLAQDGCGLATEYLVTTYERLGMFWAEQKLAELMGTEKEYGETAKDIVQKAFTKLFPPKKQTKSSFGSCLATTVNSLCVDFSRKQSSKKKLFDLQFDPSFEAELNKGFLPLILKDLLIPALLKKGLTLSDNPTVLPCRVKNTTQKTRKWRIREAQVKMDLERKPKEGNFELHMFLYSKKTPFSLETQMEQVKKVDYWTGSHKKWVLGKLEEAIENLPSPYKEVIVLKYFRELASSEIATILDSKEATVNTWAKRAREELEEMLNSYVDITWLSI